MEIRETVQLELNGYMEGSDGIPSRTLSFRGDVSGLSREVVKELGDKVTAIIAVWQERHQSAAFTSDGPAKREL